jgi:hypothetical protein
MTGTTVQASCCEIARYMKEDKIGSCNIHRKDIRNQFAAVMAHIENMELPLIFDFTPNGPPVEFLPCIKDTNVSIKYTILALLFSCPNFTNIVVFASCKSDINPILRFVSSLRMRLNSGTTVCISKEAANSFVLDVHEIKAKIEVTENIMLSMISDIVQKQGTIVIYLDSNLIEYHKHFNMHERSLCITFNSGNFGSEKSACSVLMPMFYNVPKIENLVKIRAGSLMRTVLNESSMALQINTICDSLLCAVTSNNMCYFCAYVTRIHSIICKPNQHILIEATIHPEIRRFI